MPWTLNRVSLIGGTYRGLLVGEGEPPALEMAMGDEVLGHLMQVPVKGAKAKGQWQVEGDIGTGVLTEGTRTVVIRGEGQVLDALTVIAGLGAQDDLRAEVDALRAELALLKAAFRRHVTETD